MSTSNRSVATILVNAPMSATEGGVTLPSPPRRPDPPPASPAGVDVALPRVRVAHPHVMVDPSVLSGSPTIIGTRVPVRRLWAWHRGGTAVETLMRRYPQLGPAKVLDALAFAYDNEDLVDADLAREQALMSREASTGAAPEGLRPMAQQTLPLPGGAVPAASSQSARRRR